MTRREALLTFGAAATGAFVPARPVLGSSVQRPLPRSEFDYVDWSWERWREITGNTRPTVTSAQAGRAELLDLVDAASATPSVWETRRAGIHDVLRAFIGEPPAARTPLDPRVIAEERTPTHTRRTLTFRAVTGEVIPAFLLVPHVLRDRAPGVLCPHQTTQEGKREPAGLAGNPEQFTARALVERGYVTLTWDAMCFGERHDRTSGHYGDAIPFYKSHPRWSLLGKMVSDTRRALDFLAAQDHVDAARIGCMGHSHGGITTIFAMAADDRIRAGVANCGFDTFRIDGNAFRWSHATALLPRLGFYVSSPYINMDNYRAVPDSEVVRIPFDMHEVLALAAPRPLLLATSDDDFVFPNAGWSARRSLAKVRPVYRALEAGDRLEAHFFSAGHRLPADMADRAGAWLDRWLK